MSIYFNQKWYDAAGGFRMTDCCRAFSQNIEGFLRCKSCLKLVPRGAGDGFERMPKCLEQPIERGSVDDRLFVLLEDLSKVKSAAVRLVISSQPSNHVVIDRALEAGYVVHKKGRGRGVWGTSSSQVLYLTPKGKAWRQEASCRKVVAGVRAYWRRVMLQPELLLNPERESA